MKTSDIFKLASDATKTVMELVPKHETDKLTLDRHKELEQSLFLSLTQALSVFAD